MYDYVFKVIDVLWLKLVFVCFCFRRSLVSCIFMGLMVRVCISVCDVLLWLVFGISRLSMWYCVFLFDFFIVFMMVVVIVWGVGLFVSNFFRRGRFWIVIVDKMLVLLLKLMLVLNLRSMFIKFLLWCGGCFLIVFCRVIEI